VQASLTKALKSDPIKPGVQKAIVDKLTLDANGSDLVCDIRIWSLVSSFGVPKQIS